MYLSCLLSGQLAKEENAECLATTTSQLSGLLYKISDSYRLAMLLVWGRRKNGIGCIS